MTERTKHSADTFEPNGFILEWHRFGLTPPELRRVQIVKETPKKATIVDLRWRGYRESLVSKRTAEHAVFPDEDVDAAREMTEAKFVEFDKRKRELLERSGLNRVKAEAVLGQVEA